MERGPGGDGKLQQGGSEEATSGYLKTSDRGYEYEVLLCCLLFLRAARLTSDFFLSCSNARAGKLDDVVLIYRPKGDHSLEYYQAVLLQAKHKENTSKKLKLTASNPFQELEKYVASFKDIKDRWKEPLEVQGQQIQVSDISLVPYTNSGCVIGHDAADDVTNSSDVELLRDILNTGGRLLRISDARRAGLPQEPETIKNLILCIEQTNVEAADEILEEEISKMLKLTSKNDAKRLILEMKPLFEAWRREEEGRYLTVQSVEWKGVLELQATHLNSDSLTIQSQLNLGFTKVLLELFKSIIRHTQVWISVADQYQGRATRVRLLEALRTCLVLDVNFLETHLDEVEALWGTAACPTLALDMSASSLEEHLTLLQSLQTALSSQAARKLVVIAKEDPAAGAEWFVHQAEATWSLLDIATKRRLMSVRVELQGKIVPLGDVIVLEPSPVMSDKLIHSLRDPAGGAMKLGEPLPPPQQECYVPRCMERITSKAISTHDLRNTNTFLFPKGPWTIMHLHKYSSRMISLQNLETIDDVRGTVVIRDECSDGEARRICCRFSARGLSGEFGKEGVGRKMTEFFPVTWMCDEKVVVIEGVPGVGKSSFVTAMCSRVKERFPESWVLRFDLGKHADFIQEGDFRNLCHVLAFLLKGVPKDPPHCLEQDLLEHAFFVTGNVFLFMDEISPDYTAKCCDLLKRIATSVRFRQMVVTTRPVTSEVVQEALLLLGTTTSKAFSLPVFSEEEQRLFLEQFCEAKGMNIDQETVSSLRQSDEGLLEIPLLIEMTAELLLRRSDAILLKYKNPWRKVLLYKHFVERKVNDRVAEKFGLVLPTPAVESLLTSSAQEHLQNLQSLAVRKLIPANRRSRLHVSSELPDVKLGLVVDAGGAASVDFEHQTLAEYFLGCWLARHWRRCPPQQLLLRQVLSRDGNEFVAATLSWWLFQGLPLHEAVARGDEGAVRAALMTSGGAAEDRDRGGRSPLHVAAMTRGGNHDKVADLLMANGEDPYKKDEIFGSNAIIYAEMFRNWEFVELMLEKGKTLDCLTFFTDQNAAKEILTEVIKQRLTALFNFILDLHQGISHQRFHVNGNTLLHLAAAHNNNNTAIVKALIDMNHDVNLQNHEGDTPLHGSCVSGHLEVVNLLLQNGADPNIKNRDGKTPLIPAAFQGHLEVVKLLVEKGADTNVKTENGPTALMVAAAGQGHLEVAKVLIQNGADPNLTDVGNGTALMVAAGQGHVELVKLLIGEGADPNSRDVGDVTALTMAAGQGHLEVVKLLIEKGADPKLKAKYGVTVLMRAAGQGNLELVKLLTEMGADLNLQNEDGESALMCAAAEGHLEVVELLLEKGADPNLRDVDDVTALMWAAGQGHLELVKLLLEKGADPNSGDVDDATALMRAARQGHQKIVKLLIETGADPNLKHKDSLTALMMTAGQGRLEVVKLLMEMGADPNLKSKNGLTALMLAAVRGHLEVVKVLMEMGADPNLRDVDGVTALNLAQVQGHLEVVKVLMELGSKNRSKWL